MRFNNLAIGFLFGVLAPSGAVAGSFKDSCKDCKLGESITDSPRFGWLRCACGDSDPQVEINSKIGNVNGTLVAGKNHFMGSCLDTKVEGATLKGDCKLPGGEKSQPASLDLDKLITFDGKDKLSWKE